MQSIDNDSVIIYKYDIHKYATIKDSFSWCDSIDNDSCDSLQVGHLDVKDSL